MSTQVTLTGNLTADVELRFTAAGKAVAKFTVVTARRKKDADTGEWVEDGTTFWNVTAWDRLGEHIAESCLKGDTVIVLGTAENRSWEKDGQKYNRIEVTANKVGMDIGRFIVRPDRDSKRMDRSTKADGGDPWSSAKGALSSLGATSLDDVPF
jgi:single-strand DNA-binding protein